MAFSRIATISFALLWITVAYVPDDQKSFISLRDEEFVGPDKALEAELARRMQAPPSIVAEVAALEKAPPPHLFDPRRPYLKTSIEQMEAMDSTFPETLFNGNPTANNFPPGTSFRRRADARHNTSGTAPWPQYSKWDMAAIKHQPEFEKLRILQFQQLLVQLALERIEDLNHLIRDHETDERYRAAYIFCKLRQWLDEMRQYMYSTTLHNTARPVRKHIIYYQHILRRNIDITYTIEFFLHTHALYLEKFATTYNLRPTNGTKPTKT